MSTFIVKSAWTNPERTEKCLGLLGTPSADGKFVEMSLAALADRLSFTVPQVRGHLSRRGLSYDDEFARMATDPADAIRTATPTVTVAPGALSGLLSLCAELIAAKSAHERAAEPVLLRGGRTAGYDIEDLSGRCTDAKNLTPTSAAEKAQGAGGLKLTNHNHQTYDPEAVDELALVSGLDPTTVAIAYTDDEITITIPTDTTRVHVKTPDEANRWLVPGCGARVVWLDDKDLAS